MPNCAAPCNRLVTLGVIGRQELIDDRGQSLFGFRQSNLQPNIIRSDCPFRDRHSSADPLPLPDSRPGVRQKGQQDDCSQT
jgi:hypothetical protein